MDNLVQESQLIRLITGAANPLRRSSNITAVADLGNGFLTVTQPYHGFKNGDVVTISGTTSYNNPYSISNVTRDTYDIRETFVATETGTGVVNVPLISCFPPPVDKPGTITSQNDILIGVGTDFEKDLIENGYVYAGGVVRRIKGVIDKTRAILYDFFPTEVSAVPLQVPAPQGFYNVTIKNTHASVDSIVQEAALPAGDSVLRNFQAGQAPISYNATSSELTFEMSL